MPIEKTLLLKIGTGVVAAGAASGGYYARTKGLFKTEKQTFENEKIKDYLIVKSMQITPNANGEIYENGFFFSQRKNFLCSSHIVDTKSLSFDEECEIYKLSDKEKALAKAIDNNFAPTTKNIKEAGNYFKINLPELWDDFSEWETEMQLIQIAQISDKSKLFGKLMPIYKVKNGEIIGRKTSFLYTKVKDAVGTGLTQPTEKISPIDREYKCKLKNTLFSCWIFQLTDVTGKKIFSLPEKETLNATDLIKKDQYFKIKMEEKHLRQINFDDSQTIDVIPEKNVEEGKYFAKLTPLFHTIDKEVRGKDIFWLALNKEANDSGQDASDYTNCQINASSEKFKCEIYKFNQDPSNIDDMSFSGDLTKTTAASDIKNNKYSLVKFLDNSSIIDNLKINSKIILTSSSDVANKSFTFDVQKRLFIDATIANNELSVIGAHVLDA